MTPAVAGERVFAGSCGGTFYALDAATGAVAWSHDTGSDGALGQFHGDPLVAGELVVAGSHARRQGFLYAFERGSGSVRWRQGFPRGVEVQAYRFRDTVLAVVPSGEVVAVDLATGDFRWRTQVPREAQRGWGHDPVLAAGSLFVPWRSGQVDAVDAATGEHLWRHDTGAPLDTSAAWFEDEVVVGSREGGLLRLDPGTGELRGAFDPAAPGGAPYGDLVPAGGCLLALEAARRTEELPELAGPFSLGCLRPASGEIVWRHLSEESLTTERPLVRGGAVVVGGPGLLRALDLRDGGVLWEHPIDGTPRGLGASPGFLFVGTREGRLLALPWPAL